MFVCIITCCKLLRCDAKRLHLQSEGVESEGRHHLQGLLRVAHVGAAQRASQEVQTGVTGREGS